MGIEYYLADTEHKTFYELGRGSWYELEDGLSYLADQELLLLHLQDYVYTKEYHTEEEWRELSLWLADILVPDLYRHFGNSTPSKLRIVPDSTDDLIMMKAKKYTCLGSRYYYNDPVRSRDNLQWLNRHLEDNERNRRFYDPKDYQQYPEWNLY